MNRALRKGLRTLAQGLVSAPATAALSVLAGAPSRVALGIAAATVGIHALTAWAQNHLEDTRTIPTLLPSPPPGGSAPLVQPR